MGVIGTAFSVLTLLMDITAQGVSGSPAPLVNRLVFGRLLSKIPLGKLLKKYSGIRTPLGVVRQAMNRLAPEEVKQLRFWLGKASGWRKAAAAGKQVSKELEGIVQLNQRERAAARKKVINQIYKQTKELGEGLVDAQALEKLAEEQKENQQREFDEAQKALDKQLEVVKEQKKQVEAISEEIAQEKGQVRGKIRESERLLRQRRLDTTRQQDQPGRHRYTLQEIMRLSDAEISTLPVAEKRRIRQVLYDVYAKRADRLAETDVFSPAIDSARNRGIIKRSQKEIADTELDQQIRELRTVLRNKTSTVRGARDFKKKTASTLDIETGAVDQYTRVMRLYEELYQYDPWAMEKWRMYDVTERVVLEYDTASMSDERIKELLQQRLENLRGQNMTRLTVKLNNMGSWRGGR